MLLHILNSVLMKFGFSGIARNGGMGGRGRCLGGPEACLLF